MKASRTELYVHMVWATYRRMPLVVGDVEQAVYASIKREAQDMGCEILAIGGMPDHVHVALRMATTVAPAQLAKKVKGVSSTLVRREILPGETFGWQDGYGAFSFSRSHCEKVIAYVRNQKRHHESSTTWNAWEPSYAG